ncbi:DNA-binding domain-containing protein [Pseudomonas sp. CAU 1711]|uniref:DNA-binding domain-containing protein n=1 Tax=Pseudomonas sp. CAU 1711 TaxID=3140356 RepID=UPI0032619A21
MTAHEQFAQCLLQDSPTCPSGLRSWNGSDPAQRFAIYRNNVVSSLIDALADTYPVTQAMVGEAFFRAMARLFVRAQPPRSPVLALYGDGFADFIEGFAPAARLPYLADLARLEMLYLESYHAADATALALDELAALLGDSEALAQVRFELHPALQLLRSPHAVVSLWSAHQGPDVTERLSSIDLTRGEAALLMRRELAVEIMPIERGAAEFIDNLRRRATFASAADTAEPFDLSAALELLLRCGAIIRFTTQE